jgi:hypothetical protein
MSTTKSSLHAGADSIKTLVMKVHFSWIAVLPPYKVFKKKLEGTLADTNHNNISPWVLLKMAYCGLSSPFAKKTMQIIDT